MKPMAERAGGAEEEVFCSEDRRRQQRYRPDLPKGQITLEDGSVHACDVLDVSLGGASLLTDAPGAPGEVVTLGQMRGPIIRMQDGGFVIEFDDGR